MTIPSTVSDVATNGKLKGDRTAYLQQLLALRRDLGKQHPTWLNDLRDRATARVQELAIPSNRDEEWRFTDLSQLLQNRFQASNWQSDWHSTDQPLNSSIQLLDLEPFILPEVSNRLVFIDGIFSFSLSVRTERAPGVFIDILAGHEAFEASKGGVQEYLAKQPGTEEVFTVLNTASFQDVALIWLPQNTAIAEPIQLLFVSTKGETATISHPRCLVIARSGSNLSLVEEYISLGNKTAFTNAVTEIYVGENAQVNHTRIQRENAQTFHIGKTAVSQARDSRYTCNAVSLGAKLSRHNLEVHHTGEQTETTLNGLTIIGGEQVADTHSTIAYAYPHGSSNQIHKCIVDDRAHAVFNGKVFVPKAAQLTDAKQLSSNLLLSPKARVDTKPQLEITADNVKCTHGATVSQLDSDEVFYLQSRGIDEDSARKLLTYAFAYEVIQEIPVASLREKLAAIVREQQVTSQKG